MSNNYIDELFDNLRRDPFNNNPTNDTSYELQKDFLSDPQGPEGWIADGVITDVELVDGSTLVGKVDALPTLPADGYPEGKVVYLTTNGKLYRNDSDVWTSAVPTVDLTGQITETQITDGSITTAKVAANAIVADKIASNAITTDKLNANSVTAAKIAAGTITATEIAANTITAAKIAAGTITTTEIAANTITAADIAAGTITATQIATGTITAASAIIADAAITGAKIANATITDANISSLNADKLTAGTISAVDVLASRITNDPLGVGLLIQGDGAGVDAGFGGVNDAVIYSGYNATSVDNAIENASNFIYLSPDSITLPDETVGAGVVISGADGVVIVGENTMIGTESNVGNLGGNYVHIRRDFDSEGIDLATEGGVSINTWNDNNAYATLTVSANGIGTQQARAIEASGTSEFEIIRATSTTDASLSSTGHAFQIGASSGQNLRIDSNEIMVVNNGGTTGMFLQSDGGTLQVGGNTTIVGTLTATNLVSNNDVTLTGTVINQRSSAAADVWLSSQIGDSVNRFLIEADGGHFWGSGSATRDTNLYRGAANLLETDDNFQVGSQLRVVAPTGTTQTSSQAIYFFVSGNGSYELRRNTSSARYKTNIVDADEVVLEAARKVKPRHYESTIEAEAGATRLGFIAEEIHEAGLTHAVGYDEEGKPETIDPTALIAALWHRVNDLETRLAALEGDAA